MKRLFIIRHGKTAWNLAKRLQGAGADSQLLTADLTGYHQLARYLAAYPFTQVYTSPITRAKQTATIVTQAMGLTLPIHSLPGLKELSFGQWEGKQRADLIATSPALFAKLSRRENDPALQALGVEDFAQARARFRQALQQIAARLGENENALVFSHGGISQLGIKAATGNENLLGLKNLSTSILAVHEHRFYLDVYNQTAYLTHTDLDEGNVSIL
ncbi:MAG: histidine phosphatase family protein [Lactobacillus sp.]|jgi:probable phosphoglycerate mutase|uniref:Histidine phosphatase family protein n=1 Tax=Lacticaseibacillus suilingensis TaxID=2799577 RepID=A0ABW4BIM8_9LACO|nr:histidine phosphatase family protein [Lacticaseibacillus suilingensis]MCI1894399.1 histidine phosphatase family protein [Lactobacillus sp.]MCI1916971.1 histidine phosphatase family protein [Lactobacillus sp.]MCI1941780.1 histidine phosphatase family protein [Lactobacillus sp.]MCI1972283.1 histidine phosphatase family protein [Lactobacillus sp.]MCI2017317.1 histidine phosphatase family protein [Lactobacillus sp.]